MPQPVRRSNASEFADWEAKGYPHDRRQQRFLEKQAGKSRESSLNAGVTVLPMCGFEYKYRPTGSTGKDYALRHCLRNAGAGNTNHPGKGWCDYHEVEARLTATKAVTNKAAVRKAREIAFQNATFLGDRRDIGPHEALLTEVQRSSGIVEWLHDKMKLLNSQGVPDDKILGQYSDMGVTPSIWMQLFNEERKHLVNTCVAAIRGGVQERQVRMAEEQGRMIAMIMMALVNDPELGLNSTQLVAAPDLIRKHLTAIPRMAHESPIDGAMALNRAIEANYSEER